MNLRVQAYSSVKWTTIASLFNMTIQIVQLAVLTRLLIPEDFGLMAIVMVIIGLSELFIDMGVSNAIIYKQINTKNELSSLYWLNVFVGCIFFLLTILLSPLIAEFYEKEKLITLLNLVAITFLIKPWGQQLMVMLQKEMQFNSIAKTEIISRLLSFVTIITLALLEYNVYSLAVGAIVYSICSSIGFNFFGRKLYRTPFHFKFRDLTEYIHFGLFQMGDKFLNFFASQMDTLLIGKLLGLEILGIYNVAKDLTSKPYGIINPIISKVTFPMMSKISNDAERLKNIFFKTINYLSFINIPVYLLLAFFAKEIVILLIGYNWIEVIPVIQILAVSFILRSIGSPAGSLLLSKGKANIVFFWNVIIFILYPVYLYIGSFLGAEGVALGMLTIQITLFYPNWKYIVRRYLDISFSQYLRSILSPLLFTLSSILLSLSLTFYIDNPTIKLILNLLLFGIFYLITLIRFEKDFFTNLIDFLPKIFSERIMGSKLVKSLSK